MPSYKLTTGRTVLATPRKNDPLVSDVEMADGKPMSQPEWDEYAALVVAEKADAIKDRERIALRYQPLRPQRNMLDELEQPVLF
jgi:hypothetical protein